MKETDKVLITGKPSLKIIPILAIIVGVGLTLFSWIYPDGWSWDAFAHIMMLVSPCILLFSIFLYWYCASDIVVTDKRVYGKACFGKRVDLPLDKISAVGTMDLFKSIEVSTSSGVIRFMYVENAHEIHEVINGLLLARQGCKSEKVSETESLIRYKELLDSGVINKEEFEAKKKQILGL